MPRSTRVAINAADDLSHTGLSPSMAGLSRPLLLDRQFVTALERYSALNMTPTTPC